MAVASAAMAMVAAPANASLPGETPRSDYGVNGKVRAVAQVGPNVWVGGQFTQVVHNSSGAAEDDDQETNLVAFDAIGGTPVDIGPDLGGVTGAIVYDLSVGPDGTTVYAAGKFRGGGATNLVAFDGLTGTVMATYSTPALFSVHADATGIYAGGGGSETGSAKLWRVTSSTSETVVVSVRTEPIGAHVRKPQVVDIVTAPQGGLFIACKCDSIDSAPAKAFAHINADGSYDTTWEPGNLLTNDGAAFGWEIFAGPTLTYLAAGGSDFVMAVDTLTGARRWVTDTNGSAQAITYWSDAGSDRVIVGGHWRLIDDGSGWYCQPRLAALEPATGGLDRAWHPAPNPSYNGVWAVAQSQDGSALWVGGEFRKIAEDWVRVGDDCAYINGDPAKPRFGTPNVWARAIAKLAP